jgi:hypothetical protein
MDVVASSSIVFIDSSPSTPGMSVGASLPTGSAFRPVVFVSVTIYQTLQSFIASIEERVAYSLKFIYSKMSKKHDLCHIISQQIP